MTDSAKNPKYTIKEYGDTPDADAVRSKSVRIRYFPRYSDVRHLLRILPGLQRTLVTELRSTVESLRGTPQNPMDWTDPSSWISERLEGEIQDLAHSIWNLSAGELNPRYLNGAWYLANTYELIKDNASSVLQITHRGSDFLNKAEGSVEFEIDEIEGLVELLSIIAERQPARFGELTNEWREFLFRHSAMRKDSTIRDFLRRRLSNLVARGYLIRKGNLYSVSSEGVTYVRKQSAEFGQDAKSQIQDIVRQRTDLVRQSLRERIASMSAYDFEHLVKRLLESMGYEDVEVTSQGGDGGVDVIGKIQLGITSVIEVIQAKKHQKTIQRSVLDALRGSLYRFNAVRGTIVTTSKFSKGAKEEAFANGAAPITLIDGDRLLDLLIEYGIGVKKETISVLSMDEESLVGVEDENMDIEEISYLE